MEQNFFSFQDEALSVAGTFPQAGDLLHSFMLVDEKLHDVALEQFLGKPKLLLTLLSIDSPEQGLDSLQQLRRALEHWPQLVWLVVSVDSPFSLAKAHREHGLPHVHLLSTLRGRDFHKHYGVLIQDIPLAGFTCPAVWLADADDRILFAQRLDHTDAEFDLAGLKHALAELFKPAATPESDGEDPSETTTPA